MPPTAEVPNEGENDHHAEHHATPVHCAAHQMLAHGFHVAGLAGIEAGLRWRWIRHGWEGQEHQQQCQPAKGCTIDPEAQFAQIES
jgi:hypothetical protein